MRKSFAIVEINAIIKSAKPDLPGFILHYTPNRILCWRNFRGCIRSWVGVEIIAERNYGEFFTIVFAKAGVGAKPNISRFIFKDRSNIIAIQAIFLGKIYERFSIVAVNAFVGGAKPK